MSLFLLFACAGGSPGFLTVSVAGVTGAEGLLLVTEARDDAGNQAGVACVPIDADPFDWTGEIEEIVGATPCEDSAPVELAYGAYSVLTAVLAGGETEPRSCAEATVTVDGDVTVEMPALGACD